VPETISSREFNQNISAAKKAARKEPVIITDRGKPAHVLMTYEHYSRLTASRGSIVDMLGMPDAEDIDFEPARLPAEKLRLPDLS
jgi:prevent-host-death family protein